MTSESPEGFETETVFVVFFSVLCVEEGLSLFHFVLRHPSAYKTEAALDRLIVTQMTRNENEESTNYRSSEL